MPASSKFLVCIEGLGVHRGDKQILRGVDWTIREGEHWVVLGANGCGKTSLLKALTGYLTPTRGTIQLLGEQYGETDWREIRPDLLGSQQSFRRTGEREEDKSRVFPAHRRRETFLISGAGPNSCAGREFAC